MQAVRKLIVATLAASAMNAHALVVTSAFDGGWFDPEHAGQGFTFEQIPRADGSLELLVYFSTFDIDGTPTLLVGQAPITGNVVQMTLNRPVISGVGGGGVLPNPLLVPSGSLRLEMQDCNIGKADFVVNPRPGAIPANLSKIRVGTGSLRIKRLSDTTGEARRCTGGISDNTLAIDNPESFESFYVGGFVDARIFYEKRSDRSELSFDLRSLPVGTYNMLIDGVQIAVFESVPFRESSRAQLRFTSPLVDGARLLDFKAVDRTVTLVKSGESNIRDEFRTPQRTNVLDTQPIFVGPAVGETRQLAEVFGNDEVGGFGVRAQENFLFEAELEESGDATELTLNVENAEAGFYDVVIGGKRRGTVYVLPQSSGVTFGKARFRKPVEAGAFPLDFEPRGAEVLFLREGNLEFVATILQED